MSQLLGYAMSTNNSRVGQKPSVMNHMGVSAHLSADNLAQGHGQKHVTSYQLQKLLVVILLWTKSCLSQLLSQQPREEKRNEETITVC